MDELVAYYLPQQPPAVQYSYHQPPPPPPPGATYPPYNYQPPPPAAVAQPALYTTSFQDEVRTLFIAGLPEDVKAREIYNLFREFPGYESCHLRSPTPTQIQPFGFAVFVDQPSALAALHTLNGMVFDLEKGSTLFIDLAKSNSRSKRSRPDDERHGFDKRAKGTSAFSRVSDPGETPVDSLKKMLLIAKDTHLFSDIYVMEDDSELVRGVHIILEAHIAHVLHAWALAGVGSVHVPGLNNSAYNMIGYPSAQSHGSFTSRAVNTSARPRNSTAPPCPTIFVANLGPTCTDQELTQVFSRCRGFLKLKVQSTYGTPVAFVDFVDTACSTDALNHLQGTVLYSSVSGEGMRLEFAKSRMGMRSKKSR